MVHKTLLAKVAFVLATLGPGSTSIFAQVAPTQQTSQATTQQAGQTTPQKTKPQATKPSLIDFLSKSVFYNGDGGDLVFQTPDNPGVPLKAMNFTVKGENYGLKLSPSEQTSITALGQKVIDFIQSTGQRIDDFQESSLMHFNGNPNMPVTPSEVGIFMAAAASHVKIAAPSTGELKAYINAHGGIDKADGLGAIAQVQQDADEAKVALAAQHIQIRFASTANGGSISSDPDDQLVTQALGQMLYDDTYNPSPATQQQNRNNILAAVLGPTAPPAISAPSSAAAPSSSAPHSSPEPK